MKTLDVTKTIHRSPLRRGFLRIPLVLAWFALFPSAWAADGGRPNQNTAEGTGALSSLTSGTDNTAVGFDALYSITDGSEDTATGSLALANDTGGFNTAYGFIALNANTTGQFNTAIGRGAMFSNTTGINNTATGGAALGSNTTGAFNTATGRSTMFSNTTGILNTAHGYRALYTNTTGGANTANGFEALLSNTTGANNTGEGFSALFSNTTGHGNIALGFRAGINLTTGSRNIDIGNEGVAGESGKIRIGTSGEQKNAFIAGISGTTVPGGVAVIIGTDGHLGTVTSSERFKDQIKPMDKASEAIFGLKPVMFHYKRELDPNSIPQFGLVAEQVEKVNPGLVARDEEGKPYTVRYEAVNAMLLNEFLKEHRTVQEQKATIAQLKKDFAEQQKQIEALTTGLQKVSVQAELSKPAPQTVVGN
ncbi:MAG: hypothetical protein DME58_09015 [Verrucomicrobia bacterium]|nr:MAG: hypothetical protein DME58_09015 [Verrucomicrobiota bacterium]